ncbi:MAG: uracil phosphoribosyltransferase [Myxococcales bacterium]|nr:uracil phosphoribosyltransferase [Myxococcales bacterium]
MDSAYRDGSYSLSEMDHSYGPNAHIIKDPVAWTYLGRLGHPTTTQPETTDLTRLLYQQLLHVVVAREFPQVVADYHTRMIAVTPRGRWMGTVIDPATKVVTVDLARAGMVPSQLCFDVLNRILPNANVRQDHIVMNRATDAEQRVTGTDIYGQKIGGDVDDRILLFPDPMGATGSSMCSAISTYKNGGLGTPQKFICMHLIVTPEYIQRVHADHPDARIYALRLDRGLSDPDILDTLPGTHPSKECGLNDVQYIVPGAGGVGELLNNAEV